MKGIGTVLFIGSHKANAAFRDRGGGAELRAASKGGFFWLDALRGDALKFVGGGKFSWNTILVLSSRLLLNWENNCRM